MLLVGNGRMVTRHDQQPYLENGCVAIRENLVVEVGPTNEMKVKYPEASFLDARGKLIMPGLINTHMHLYSTFARGMALKDDAPSNFQEILERLWWRLDKILTLEDVYYSALVPLIDCIKNGTTTIFDHHASPGTVRESLPAIAKATVELGVRSCLCYEVSDRDGAEVANQGIRENVEFIRHCHQEVNPILAGMFGLHASFTISDQTLARCCQENSSLDTGFHIHTAEGPGDVANSLDLYGKRVVERLAGFGILGTKTITAHCVHINDEEISLLKESGTRVVHNPESNMGNAVGCAPVIKMFREGVNIGLGTDGYTSDMFESLKVANILHKHQLADPRVGWVEAPAMLFRNNAEIAGQYFSNPVGKLAPGAFADLIIVNYDPPTPMHPGNIESHIIFGISGPRVETTIINGRVVMKDRCLAGIDEERILARSRELAKRVWQEF